MASQQSTQSSFSNTSHNSPPKTFLSILNVVVDHVMMEPCPLEPEEFYMNHQYDLNGANEMDIGGIKKSKAKSGQKRNDGAVELFPNNGGNSASATVGQSFADLFPGPSNSNQNDHANTNHPNGKKAIGNSNAKSNKSSVLVPVLRIFGPVLRNGDDSAYHRSSQDSTIDGSTNSTNSYSQQPQSGCLHIHGAYPYLLARPVIAGPDGSMHHGHYYKGSQSSSHEEDVFSPKLSSDDSSMKRSNIDWDNVDSVSLVLEEVHQQLEGALRASLEHSPNQQQSQLQQSTSSSSMNYIRSVTVVTGRGFYTYCSGPPAPFLRVEYYDPSLRWRVKLILERGVELNNMYHPDPRVYDYEFEEEALVVVDTDTANRDVDIRPLRFRCYEAHIPYTMQVFKDLNLAGLKYVNVGQVRFRDPLPRSLRKRTKEDFLRKGTEHDHDDSAFFLKGNVREEWLWPNFDDDKTNNSSQQQNHQSTRHWLKKQTSCDLEFDTTVDNILNVHDVMTELPSPLEERQKIHWRAVPSLKEIWEQERKRMGILLSPEKDFLSFDDKDGDDEKSSGSSSSEDLEDSMPQENTTPQFTLNVKKGASVPGTRLAVKGVKQLFRTSDGLEDDFRRALKDIVSRHDKFLDDVDRRITNGSVFQQHSTPTLEDGIEALAALGDQFTQNSVDSNEDEVVFGSQSFALSSGSIERNDTNPSSRKKYTMTQMTQEEIDEERELLEFGASIDSDAILDSYSSTNNINPSVLDPHDGDGEFFHNNDDFLCEEDAMGEEGFERTLTYLASQAVEASDGNKTSIEYEEDLHADMNHHYSQLCADNNDDNHCDDEVDIGLDEEESSSLVIEELLDENSTVESGPFVQHCPQHMASSNDSIDDSNGIVNYPEDLAALPDQLVLRPSTSLRCGDLTSQSALWRPIPKLDMSDADHDALPPVKCGSFLEPVKHPPSYNEVRRWMKANMNSSQHNNNPDQLLSQSRYSQLSYTQFSQYEQTQDEVKEPDPLAGLGQQGCRVQVSGGGGLKTSIHTPSTFTPMTIMSIEVHVQCRIKTGLKGHREVAMVPDSTRDAVFAVVYVFARDPGGGENIEVIEKGSVLVLVEPKQGGSGSVPTAKVSRSAMGISSDVSVECVASEKSLLRRIASIIQLKDPDILVSWDTQGMGLGYIVERGIALGKPVDGSEGKASNEKVDMARLLGRTPRRPQSEDSNERTDASNELKLLVDGDDGKDDTHTFAGSGLGAEWDDRVGAGAAAASIAGRIVICGWKICSEECKHPNASYQPAIVSAVLNKRIPFHDDLVLTRWYSMDNGLQRWRVIEYRLTQALSNVLLLDELDVLGRAGEAARLSGVEFSQSLPGIRGSQYKVEGVLLRALQSVRSNERGEKKGLNNTKASGWQGTALTATLSAFTSSESQSQSPWKRRRLDKTEQNESSFRKEDLGYFFYSPSKDDCSKQEALECQALTLEPSSGFHFDPVVVCDFTALYPSLVIAYNLCYSTVAGKLDYHSTRKEMRTHGKTTTKIGPFQYSERRTAAVIKHHMKSVSTADLIPTRKMRDRAYAVPTGSLFVSETVLKGVLPQVLDEMLSTRAMLKKAAKEYKKQVPNLSAAVLRQIEARQLALKYVANVTYGYTSATFSGRSACPLVADAIVECGRRTLTNAINLANRWGKEENGRWYGAQVLYGDTDSVFIKLPGRSVKEAFAFGEEYCKAVTASNPPPVQLKLEKVYAGCLLQTKKKYCGMMCESASQKRPAFEAKGIETVRRDQCALTQKILRNALIKVFQSGISATKEYLRQQWSLIHAGKFPVSDFVLTGRVRSRYRGGKIGPVQAALARRLGEVDPGRVVRHKERLPYVIVASPGKAFKLRDCVLTPLELLEQWDSYTIHSAYYITKHVNAALQRCFGLAPFNVNVHSWYEACPKPRQKIHFWPLSRSGSSLMISSYFGSDICSLCDNKCKSTGSSRVAACPSCREDSTNVACTAIDRLNCAQQQANNIAAICSSCNGCLETSDTFANEVFLPPSSKKKDSAFAFNANQRKAGVLCNPMANCTCIDCPITYLRHELRQTEIEASELMKAIF